MADRYDDARMDHFRALLGSRWPHRARRRHACTKSLAMGYDRILRLVERTRGLWSGASREGGLETLPAHPQVSVEERTQRFMVNSRTFRRQTLGIDHYYTILVEGKHVRPYA